VKPYFGTEERIKALRFHAAELVDTPFAAHAMVPGVGIDCVHVNAWCYLKTRLLTTFAPPQYQLDEGQHAEESKLIKWLRGAKEFRELDALSPGQWIAPGDTICFDVGKSEFHVGLMLDRQHFIHVLAMHRGRVIISNIVTEVYYARRLRSVFRPIDP
jgi:cell wall-associated NlpC family hydrolase